LPTKNGLDFGVHYIALSSGAACTSAKIEPSHVLKALGVGESAYSSVRFGLGRFNTQEEVDYVIRRIVEIVGRLRELSHPREQGMGRERIKETT
jgi:cysteine desulfurase